MEMERKEFFEAIKDSFFEEKSVDFEGFKSMIRGAMPVFGTLGVEVKDEGEDEKIITFIDNDEADMIMGSEEVNINEVNTDMSTVLMELSLNSDGVIKTVSHGIGGFFTPTNKEQVLLLASLIGKKIHFW